jgi:hypothetical protein
MTCSSLPWEVMEKDSIELYDLVADVVDVPYQAQKNYISPLVFSLC